MTGTSFLRRLQRASGRELADFVEALGAPSLVHYGLRQTGSKLSAHVWVSLGGAVVVGEETDDFHTCVAVFPPAPS